MNMQKEYRKELRRLKKLRTAEAKRFCKTADRINAEFEREQRGYHKRNDKLIQRIAILEGRLS